MGYVLTIIAAITFAGGTGRLTAEGQVFDTEEECLKVAEGRDELFASLEEELSEHHGYQIRVDRNSAISCLPAHR